MAEQAPNKKLSARHLAAGKLSLEPFCTSCCCCKLNHALVVHRSGFPQSIGALLKRIQGGLPIVGALVTAQLWPCHVDSKLLTDYIWLQACYQSLPLQQALGLMKSYVSWLCYSTYLDCQIVGLSSL